MCVPLLRVAVVKMVAMVVVGLKEVALLTRVRQAGHQQAGSKGGGKGQEAMVAVAVVVVVVVVELTNQCREEGFVSGCLGPHALLLLGKEKGWGLQLRLYRKAGYSKQSRCAWQGTGTQGVRQRRFSFLIHNLFAALHAVCVCVRVCVRKCEFHLPNEADFRQSFWTASALMRACAHHSQVTIPCQLKTALGSKALCACAHVGT